MDLTDTTDEARDVQRAVFRSMSPSERVAAALEMSNSMRRLLEQGIRRRHPDMSDCEVRAELLRRLHGDEVVDAMREAGAIPRAR